MKLALFFSRGVSLTLWCDKGLFDREKLLYEKYLSNDTFEKVYWFTYGCDDWDIAQKLKDNDRLHKDIIIAQMPKIFKIPKIGSYIYSILLPFMQKKYLTKCDIYKTNQTDGSWSAVIAKKIYNKKLLYRTGYTISQLENQLKRFNLFIRKVIEYSEKVAYKNCDKAIVASNHNLDYVINTYKVDQDKIDIIYNFIDNVKFYDFNIKRDEKVVFIGRLSIEKNILNLIKALKDVKLGLEIYGSGPLKSELLSYVKENNCDVKFMGNVANSELPKILNKSKYFALVSQHEGMPKALIEGMTCGCICVGTNVTGINEVIINHTGILASDISSISISNAFKKAISLNNKEIDLITKIAQQHIDNNFTLENAVKKETKLIDELINE